MNTVNYLMSKEGILMRADRQWYIFFTFKEMKQVRSFTLHFLITIYTVIYHQYAIDEI